MRRYLIRRILFFIPTTLAIALLSFLILVNSPTDPVERILNSSGGTGKSIPPELLAQQRQQLRTQLGLDLPVFYFSICSLGEPAGLEKFAESREREEFLETYRATAGLKRYIPVIRIHGNNQFHRWLFGDGIHSHGILRLDFGRSYQSYQPVWSLIRERIGWSLFFTLSSVFLAFLISVPVGIRAASRPGSRFDRTSSTLLFALYSLPGFWLATLLLMTFANPDVFAWFPASGVKPLTGYPEETGLMGRIFLSLPYLILPTICYLHSSVAILSRMIRSSMREILDSDYIRTARAKGLTEKAVLWKHALKNSLFPILTLFAEIFPAMIGGSVIIESIFTIPGMGTSIYQSIEAQDYPVLVAVLTLTGLLTVFGYLVSDLLYMWADPRISFVKIKR